MPKSHLVALIVRLLLGFLLVALVAFVLFRKLRPSTKVATSPTPAPTESQPVVIVTPSPEPSPSLLPEVSNDDEFSSPEGDTRNGQSYPRNIDAYTSVNGRQGTTHVSSSGNTIMSEAISPDGQSSARASASSGGGRSSAYAEANSGGASAWASASSN